MEDKKEFFKENKATWFRKEGATATMMIPWTPGSILAQKIKEVLKSKRGSRGTSVKFVERP